jgi:uncharacterized protein YqjF (DUF2071 family)
MASPFLTAEWQWLAMLNFEIDPTVLQKFVPGGTELDLRDGKAYVSMVGFLFAQTRVRGYAIPYHTEFEEVNLRFYVRRMAGKETRRGVVFIKELVPRRAIAWVARWVYNENYVAVPMLHRNEKYGAIRRVAYEWKFGAQTHCLSVRAEGDSHLTRENSLEAYITEHYWGYVRQRNGATVEYQVEHPRWRVWTASEANFACDVAALYGQTFAPFLKATPASAFLAEGSEVAVYPGARL